MDDYKTYLVKHSLRDGLDELRCAMSIAKELIPNSLDRMRIESAIAGAAFRLTCLAADAGLDHIPQADFLDYINGRTLQFPGGCVDTAGWPAESSGKTTLTEVPE